MNMEKKRKSTSAIVVTAVSYEMPLHDIERILVEMGIEQPVGVEDARVPNITGWLKKATARGSSNPSRPLQSALEQLFLANMDVPNRFHWGWADQRNTQLLDFFLNFDDEICFLLFVESPQALLARLSLENPKYSAEAREQALRLWRESVEKLIAFNRAWPERTLLINSLAWKFDSQNAIAYVADWLAVNINETAIAPLEPSLTDGANVLLTEVTKLSPEELYVYAPIWQEALALSPGLEVDQLADAVASFFAKFITSSIDLEKSKEVLDSKVLELTRELNQEKSQIRNDPKLEAELGDIKKENDLIIAQLHQVQEELEHNFLLLKESEEKQKIAHADSSAARDAEAQAKTAAIAERDAEANAKAQALAQVDALNNEKAKLEKSKEVLDSKVLELTEELNQQKRQVRNDPKLEAELSEIKKENDLIIAQLHQVQEELEHNFLLLKESEEKQKIAHADSSAARDAEAQAKTAAIAERDAEANAKAQALAQVDALNNEKAKLEKSKEVLDSKVLELTEELNQQKRQVRNDPKLEAELSEIKKENDLIIAQLHQVQEELNQQKSQIRNDPKLEAELGDIKKENDLIIAQLHQVQEELEHYFLLHQETEKKQKTAQATIRKYKRQLKNISSPGEAKWDYENVRLVQMINEPSYESIWIALENASFRDRQWPRFEFRLAAANIQKKGFSEQPHYEFPKMSGDKQAFEKWFVESNDDLRGERFELRFHLGQSAIDVLAWNALNEKDQEQLVRLMLAIPSILDDLADEVAAPHRGWEPWLQLNAATLELLKGLFLK